jgi:hypothetical protein
MGVVSSLNRRPRSLHQLVFVGNILDILTRLGTAGFGVDEADSEGNTPLMVACATENVVVVQILLSHGANMRKKNKKGQIAYDFTCSREVQRLVDVSAVSNDRVPARAAMSSKETLSKIKKWSTVNDENVSAYVKNIPDHKSPLEVRQFLQELTTLCLGLEFLKEFIKQGGYHIAQKRVLDCLLRNNSSEVASLWSQFLGVISQHDFVVDLLCLPVTKRRDKPEPAKMFDRAVQTDEMEQSKKPKDLDRGVQATLTETEEFRQPLASRKEQTEPEKQIKQQIPAAGVEKAKPPHEHAILRRNSSKEESGETVGSTSSWSTRSEDITQEYLSIDPAEYLAQHSFETRESILRLWRKQRKAYLRLQTIKKERKEQRDSRKNRAVVDTPAFDIIPELNEDERYTVPAPGLTSQPDLLDRFPYIGSVSGVVGQAATDFSAPSTSTQHTHTLFDSSYFQHEEEAEGGEDDFTDPINGWISQLLRSPDAGTEPFMPPAAVESILTSMQDIPKEVN